MTDTGMTQPRPESAQPWPPASPATPAPAYAPWEKRALGYLIDGIAPFVPGLLLITFVPVLGYLLYLAGIGFCVWNRIQEGKTGQTIGKRHMGTRLVRVADGQPVGPGMAVGRWFLHIVDGIFCIGYLWPLWDERRQTFADKIVDTVVVFA